MQVTQCREAARFGIGEHKRLTARKDEVIDLKGLLKATASLLHLSKTHQRHTEVYMRNCHPRRFIASFAPGVHFLRHLESRWEIGRAPCTYPLTMNNQWQRGLIGQRFASSSCAPVCLPHSWRRVAMLGDERPTERDF